MKKAHIILPFVWLLFRITIWKSGIFENALSASIMCNLLLLIVVVYIGIGRYRNTQASTLEIAKEGMRKAALYSLVVCALIFVYYQFIDTEFYSQRVGQIISLQQEKVESEGGWEAVRSQLAPRSETTESEYWEEQTSALKQFSSPWSIASISLLILVFGGAIYSLVATLLQKRLMRTVKQ